MNETGEGGGVGGEKRETETGRLVKTLETRIMEDVREQPIHEEDFAGVAGDGGEWFHHEGGKK